MCVCVCRLCAYSTGGGGRGHVGHEQAMVCNPQPYNIHEEPWPPSAAIAQRQSADGAHLSTGRGAGLNPALWVLRGCPEGAVPCLLMMLSCCVMKVGGLRCAS